MQIYNTMTRKKEELKPNEKGKIKMYVCGPTVYDYFHIGNARAFLFFDVVRNYLTYIGYDVTYIQNITDIDDKIINRANEENVDYNEFTKKYIDAFFEDLKALNIGIADQHPRASENIESMIDLITALIDDGYAYEVNGDVYFEVSKFEGYGKLSGKNLEDLQAGARVEANSQKKSPFDFTLWKTAKPNEPTWDSPWGVGRPAWHTECVVMSNIYLGDTFDIHGGGIDLIFPHHENEIAQAEAVTGKPLSNYWLHNGFLNIEGEKMSKSLDNFFTARDVLKQYDADTIRFFFLSKHYRSSIDFSKELLEESKTAMARFYEVFKQYPVYQNPCTKYNTDGIIMVREQILTDMNDDFNTAKVIAHFFNLAKIVFNKNFEENIHIEATNLLYEIGCVLGFFKNISQRLSNKLDDMTNELILLLIDIRNQAKNEKCFAISDKIRDELKKNNIELRDTPSGTEWTLIKT